MGSVRRFAGLVLGLGLTPRQADGCADQSSRDWGLGVAQLQLTRAVRLANGKLWSTSRMTHYVP